MGLKESLYNRLDQLEAEFAEYLLKELDIIVKDHASRFLYRQTSSYPEGKFSRTAEIAEAERTEKEIYDLRTKLKEPTSEGPAAILLEFVEAEKQLTDRFDGGEKHLARRTIEKLKEWQNMRLHMDPTRTPGR